MAINRGYRLEPPQSAGPWTAERLIAVVIIWVLFSYLLWMVITAVASLAAVARWNWEMVGRHLLRGLYGCMAAALVVWVCRSLYYRAEGRAR